MLPQAILAQTAQHPSNIAVVHGDTRLTYRELTDRATQLAEQLREAGVGRETTVALCLPRTPALVTAILGVWFAGGACLMMDPIAPPRRREHMLRDSQTRTVITTPGLAERFPTSHTLLLQHDGHPHSATAPVPPCPPVQVAGSHLAYVIYTSGTTGLPKGVMVEHSSLAALAGSMERALYPAAPAEVQRVALNGGTSADPFFADFVNLAYGRTLVVVDEDTRRDPERLAALLAEHQVDLFDGTPTQIRALLLACGSQALASLRVLILGSEPIDLALWQQLRALSHLRIHNYYGPTETTVYVTGAVLSEHPTPVIGAALPGNQVLVVDADLRPVPDGQIGEICIAGPQLARGYLTPGAEEHARFTTLRISETGSPVRIYRTGDRGRYNASGQVEFLGRFDNQVSISGHRVELGEVEAVLRACPGVRNTAVALLTTEEEATLAAWVVLAADVTLDHVQANIAESLPPHMLPRLSAVATIPMNTASKADIHALTTLAPPLMRPPALLPQPGQSLAVTLQEVWSSALKVDTIDPADNFFALGGDSLKATAMIVTIRKQLSAPVPIRTVFDHPCFAEFHQAITQLISPGASRPHAALGG
ncbi:non-ribosomal peptide synthetase [Streptomyces sp. NPDC050095]|uniref:non-ribosomal peptide synthetase n=1 Tax=unclassified Streptomyces TaxID=2593676 RepID=UPI0034317356